MKKVEYLQEMPFEFHPKRKGAKYLIGEKFKNHGELCESSVKFHLGLEYLVNPTTSFDTGSDIESLNASVKSARFSLANSLKGETFEEQLEDYFKRCHSTLWIYVITINESVIEYHMNEREFEEFVKSFCKLLRQTGSQKMKIRMKSVSEAKVVEWLEARL